MNHKVVAGILLTLITFSFLALFAFHKGLYRTMPIDLSNIESMDSHSDNTQGGKTTASLFINEEGLNLKCQISKQYQWPYCEVQLKLVSKDKNGNYQLDKGPDLSPYTEVYLDIEFKAEQQDRVRFYLRNYNPIYSKLDKDENSLKVNEIEFSANEFKNGNYVSIEDFNVASWWLHPRKLPMKLHGVEITSVPLIAFSSGSMPEEGEIHILIKEIHFRYNLISKQNILFAIIAMWLCASFITLLIILKTYHQRLGISKIQSAKQKETMAILKLEKNEITKLANRDQLTGIRNRVGITKHLQSNELSAQQNNIPFSLIYIDIDFFKKVNDQYGHLVGDQLLISFSHCINNNIRSQDKLARWGGEEFILISANTNLEEAKKLAEKLCKLVEKQTFNDDIRLTASFGIAQMKKNEPMELFFERADNALYVAKSNGRNQVRVATD